MALIDEVRFSLTRLDTALSSSMETELQRYIDEAILNLTKTTDIKPFTAEELRRLEDATLDVVGVFNSRRLGRMTLYRKLVLIAQTPDGKDSIGQPLYKLSEREVLVEVQSVNSTEFFSGRQGGLSPALRFRIDRNGYQGEKICKYNGIRYSIYKTYESDNIYIDLYAEEENGTTNG